MTKLFLIVFLLLVSSNSWGFDSYKCTIKSVVEVSSDGVIQDYEQFQFQVGKEFVIDRTTGRAMGAISNHNAIGFPQVLDPGSSEQSFKAVTFFKPNPMVDYLVVKEYVESNAKPFFFMTWTHLYTGLCEHF